MIVFVFVMYNSWTGFCWLCIFLKFVLRIRTHIKHSLCKDEHTKNATSVRTFYRFYLEKGLCALIKRFLQFISSIILNIPSMINIHLEVSQETFCNILSVFLVYWDIIMVTWVVGHARLMKQWKICLFFPTSRENLFEINHSLKLCYCLFTVTIGT